MLHPSPNFGKNPVMLVNAHTHSEWNASPCLAKGDGMIRWLGRVLDYREGRDVPEGVRVTASVTAAEEVSFVGDFAEAESAVSRGLVRGRCYREILREVPDDIENCVSIAPHSPHTLFHDCWTSLRGFAGAIALHAGESPEEMELYRSGGGPLAELLRARGFPAGHCEFLKGRSPMRLLDEFGLLGPRTLIVHSLHLSSSDIELIAMRGAHICLCPLSSRAIGVAFGVGPPGALSVPETRRAIERMIDMEISIAIGTDSTVSAPSLSLTVNAELLESIGIPREKIEAMLCNANAIGCG